jgi:hypothetical protein
MKKPRTITQNKVIVCNLILPLQKIEAKRPGAIGNRAETTQGANGIRGNNKLNIYTQYLMKSTFETIGLFFHRPVGLVELLILYARVQFYTPQASD